MLTRIVLLLALVLPVAASAQSLTVTRGTGASVKVDLAMGIALNKTSSLTREWVIVNDPELPLQIESGSAAPAYVQERGRGDYRYLADYTVKASEAVTAYEVRFLVLDVFGVRQRLLSVSELTDIAADASHRDTGAWSLYSEADASTAFYSVAYVAAVRTANGQVYRARVPAVLAEIQKISSAIQASDIEREKPGPTP